MLTLVRTVLAKRLNRTIVGAGFLFLTHLLLGAAFLLFGRSEPEEAAVVVIPLGVGFFFVAVLAARLTGQAMAMRRSLRAGEPSTTDAPAAGIGAIRTRPLAYLFAAGLVVTALSGPLTALATGEFQLSDMLFGGVGCVLQVQPGFIVWCAARAINKLLAAPAGHAAEISGVGGSG